MSVSEWFSDEELISQLEMMFDIDEACHMDFNQFLGQITEVNGNTREVKIKGRTFRFDIELCDVYEVGAE